MHVSHILYTSIAVLTLGLGLLIPLADVPSQPLALWSSTWKSLLIGKISSTHSKESYKVFVTGATGYIGGELLFKILHEHHYDFEVRALVRSEEKAKLLLEETDYRVTPVLGDLDSLALLEEEFLEADIIINAAVNNHLPSTKILEKVISNKPSTTILFHIAGVSILSTRDQSDLRVWSDIFNNTDINNLPNDRPHIEVDRTIMSLKNLNPEYARSVVISPATIYGTSEGFDNKISVQVPMLVKKSIELGQAFSVEDGEFEWSNVHIRDLGNMFLMLLRSLIKDKNSVQTGNQGYYFVETGTHRWIDVNQRIGELLFERGVINTTVVRRLEEQQSDELFGSPVSSLYDTNALTQADLARSYGWNPTHIDEFWENVEISVSDELDEPEH